MRARDIMTAKVVTVGPEASIDSAIALMVGQRISGIPVVAGDGRLVGMLTERDLLRRAELETESPHRRSFLGLLLGHGEEAAAYVRSHSRRVGDVMTEKVISIVEDTPLEEIVQLMEKHRIRRLPVVWDGRLVGIVSRLDLVRALGARLAAEPKAAADLPDQELEARVKAALARVSLFDSSSIAVTVAQHRARIEGVIPDEALRPAIRVAVERVPGIAAVEDRVVFVEPVTGAIYPA
ncbi:CBS domain-containing protein [Acidisoma sp. C75]